MGLARLRAAPRATERISNLVVSLLKADTYRSWSWPESGHTPQQPPAQNGVGLAVDGSVMRSFASDEREGRLRGPRSWRGARSGGSAAAPEVYLADSEFSGDLTTEALIGARIAPTYYTDVHGDGHSR